MAKYIDAELIQAIRNEIEREAKSIDTATGDFAEGRRMELRNILSVLSTLESEKPIEQDGLKEEIESYWKENGPMSHAEYDRLAKCARHFAQWGAEHLKK